MANDELKELLRSVIQEELQPVHDQLSEIKQEQQSMKRDIAEIKLEQQSMKLDIAEIKQAVLETNERVVRIEATVDKQQGVIELLSARSIQQEAQLKKII
jgi:hypothetical protein